MRAAGGEVVATVEALREPSEDGDALTRVVLSARVVEPWLAAAAQRTEGQGTSTSAWGCGGVSRASRERSSQIQSFRGHFVRGG